MAGIAGWTCLPRHAPDEALLAPMVESLSGRNRGAQLLGVVDRTARREVVLAASLADRAARISLVLDGAILNAQALRLELAKRGYALPGKGDAELLLRAYQHWDKDVAKHLRGAFAFAIWDARKERLLLARDRFGEKPLYLHDRGGGVCFASEAKALLHVPGAGAQVDAQGLRDCLACGYVPGPRTLFAGIRKLAPGTYATWQLGRLQEVRYWIPPDRAPLAVQKHVPADGESVARFAELLGDSVRAQAGSAVLLSGGVDSAAMVAVLAEGGGSVRTFTLGIENDKSDERSRAARVARHFGTQHQEIVVAPKDLAGALGRLVEAHDAPLARPSELAVHHLAAVAGREAGTLLTGDGCDEVLGGYRRLLLPPYARWDMTRRLEETERGGKPPYDADPQASRLRQRLYFGQAGPLADELLERADRAATLSGAEIRMPYLDHQLVEYVSSLPDNRRVRGLSTKWILRQAGRRLVPAAVGPLRKGGFRMPVRDWLRNEMRDTLLEHLGGAASRMRRHCDAARLDRLLKEHIEGRHDHSGTLWTLLNLEIWHRRYAPA